MKLIQSNMPLLRQFRPTVMTLVMCTLMAFPVMSQAGTSDDGFGNQRYNKRGDLTIYQASIKSNKPTLTLMLDKSGSMGGSVSFQDDEVYGYNTIYEAYKRECKRNSCYYQNDYTYTFYQYNNYSDIPSNLNYYRNYRRYTAPELTGANKQVCIMSDSSNDVYSDTYNPIYEYKNDVRLEYCLKDGEKVYDRMSKLKLAILELLAFKNVDEDIIMGVGDFGYDIGQGSTQGRIQVAAKPLDTNQKEKIYTFLRGLDPSGGTPMATAFTEAGAYMLGNSSAGGYSSNYFSGMLSTSVNSIVNNNKYVAPDTQECGAKGVYLLTDGFPSAMDREDVLKNMMGTALNTPSLSCPSSGGLLEGSSSTSRWECMGEFAKQLRTKRQVQTAMVGFGRDFNTVDNPNFYTSVERTIDKFKDVNGKPYKYNKKYYDCSQIPRSNPDARNACNLGMESGKYDNVGGYGQGGFYFAKDTKDIVGSVLSVIQDLKMDLPSIPAGTITIPQDPLSSLSVKSYAYLPMLEPKVGSDLSIWAGNLKKYNVSQGTLYGQNNKRLYVDGDGDGFPDDLNPDAQDIWSIKNETARDSAGNNININDRITAGGFYAQLKIPKELDNSTRNVYVENDVAGKKELVKIGVEKGKLFGFDKLDSSYSTLTRLYLLSFLGYDASPTPLDALRIDKLAGGVQKELEKIIANPPGDIKILGGVIHSRPALVAYGANINATDKDTDKDGTIDADAGMVANDDASRKDYVMFGSMEGALHIASAATGQENLAFIPKTILQNQVAALQLGSTVANAPVFGVDAPWMTKGSYKYDFSKANTKSSGEIIAEELYIYGGLRQGGKGLYGLDISDLDKPKMLFSLDNTTAGYQALGMAWSEPGMGKVQVGKGQDNIKDVIVFGGGYDECYEDPTFRLGTTNNVFADCNKTMADGNAVYIADAKTGAVLWSISGRSSGASNKHIQVPEMKHSVVGKITTLDRDDDGMIDHLYFADLGGQVFRVDLRNGQAVSGNVGINNFTRRVVRVLNTSGDSESDTKSKDLAKKGLQLRFYGQPSVSFHKDAGVLFAVVNIASGDRSNPLSRLRNDIPKEADRLFGIIDRDIAKQGLYVKDAAVSLTTQGLTLNNLTELPYNKASMGSKSSVKAQMKPNLATKQGWVYPLNLFDGFNNIKNVKSMGDGLAVGEVYYMTAYSPEMQYDEVSGCAAQIVGGSERQMYCLPYGICDDELSKNGTAGFVRAGKGIQELAFGALNPKNPTTRILLGTQTLSELVNVNGRINYDEGTTATGARLDTNCIGGNCAGSSLEKNQKGGSGSGGGEVTSLSYRLFSTRWYEQTAEPVDE
ncbi:hypothetical protein [Psychrobacter sp. CAL346-MNA-CIBAN-0220]|uniref:hypothetical protein n=1 Tax=Psychrobacter sp. CAL346-MNA-CIBAN-0220 TaxID=3140457 RepID=UPI0033231FEB